MTANAVRIAERIASEIGARAQQVNAAVSLLDEGATVPFIARYRKEVTGGLDDTQLRTLADRLLYLRELDERRATVLESIRSQDKLSPELEDKIAAADTKAELEDLYLPYRPKRRTRADQAREKGLGPLADALLGDRRLEPEVAAADYLNEEVTDIKSALEGARDIIAEQMSENADLLGRLRQYLHEHAFLRAKLVEGQAEKGQKFSDYFDHVERWSSVPSHRALAMMRGRNEDVLSLTIEVDADDESALKPVERIVAEAYDIEPDGGGTHAWLKDVARWAWRVKLYTSLSIDLMTALRERADDEAIRVFARNLKDLLLAAPAGSRSTMGLDPGIRTGVKVAVVDGTGRLVETATVYPFAPKNDVRGAQSELARLIEAHKVELVAIGNGTGSRETDALVAELIASAAPPKPIKLLVSEAGASVYSASAVAAAEFPELDVSLRGAVSIARRLQDPLAELVKIEPKSIGVGQYQHDVDQFRLARALDGVVEDAVNAVGVDLNTASASLLARVSGLGQSLAEAIVERRNAEGPFRTRQELMGVPRLGPKTFIQCAGFLRIRGGDEPLDASAVHPEAYDVARKIVSACGRDIASLMGDQAALRALDPRAFADDSFGLPTVRDILNELEKPGRDPRPGFRTAKLKDDVHQLKDLQPGMTLEGTVTNVAAFGAFVDVGVHQDGLVHVSQLADRFVKDPHQVVKAGDVVKVRVLEVDIKRKRIALTMKSPQAEGARPAPSRKPDRPPRKAQSAGSGKPRDGGRPPSKKKPQPQGSLGLALAEALRAKRD